MTVADFELKNLNPLTKSNRFISPKLPPSMPFSQRAPSKSAYTRFISENTSMLQCPPPLMFSVPTEQFICKARSIYSMSVTSTFKVLTTPSFPPSAPPKIHSYSAESPFNFKVISSSIDGAPVPRSINPAACIPPSATDRRRSAEKLPHSKQSSAPCDTSPFKSSDVLLCAPAT